MPSVAQGEAPGVRWAVACEAQAGEDSLGDAYLVHDLGDRTLVAVIDGLGHGREANHAARAVVTCLRQSAGRGVADIVVACHEAARRTRGVVMSLASVHGRTLEWVGVGNVEAALLRADRTAVRPVESLVLAGGVVGYQLPRIRVRSLDVDPDDLLVLATDGVRSDFASRVIRRDAPHLVAARVLRTLRDGDDDALVLAARLRPVA